MNRIGRRTIMCMPHERLFSCARPQVAESFRMAPKKRKQALSAEQLAGRVIALEALVVAALGLVLRVGRGTLYAEDIIPILDGVKEAVRRRIADPSENVSAAGETEAHRYLDHVLSNFSEQVIPKRPGQGPQKSADTD